MNLEEKISNFIDDVLKVEAVEEAFNFYIIHRPHLEAAKEDTRCQEWFSILNESHDQNDQALKFFINSAANPARNYKFNKKIMDDPLIQLLELSVTKKVVDARKVCDALLNSEHLKAERADFWLATFQLVRKIIGGVDYKGVREIMKNSIEKIKPIVAEKSPALEPQIEVVRQLLAYIFDRNAALLPGYFIVNEILKSFPENPLGPNWTISSMMADFLNSFRPTAQMVSSTLKHRMRPIAEQSGKAYQISSWKIDPSTLKFLLIRTITYDKILPYSKELVQPQKEMLIYLLRQLSSKELVNSVLGVQKPRKDPATGVSPPQRYPLLEEQLVTLFYQAMEEAEESLKDNSELDPNLSLLWWNLSSELIFFLLYQFVTFPTFVDAIHEKLKTQISKKKPMKEGRDFLMWALLQFISGSIAKNTSTDFIPVLKLFSLYDEKYPLPVPKGKSASRKLSAAAIYVHLSRKMATQSGENSKDLTLNQFGFTLPIALKEHYDYLRSLSKNEDFDVTQSLKEDYKVPLLCNTFSTAQEYFQVLISDLIKTIAGGNVLNVGNQIDSSSVQTIEMAGSNVQAYAPTVPLSMEILDQMSVHAKMSLTHSIGKFVSLYRKS